MPSITLSMIVKNEERYLNDCLNSIKDIVDEIVIVDTGSTDKTIEIAKKFNSKVYTFNWVNDFSAARNYALSKSSCDWILYLDADERFNGNSKKELFRIIKENKKLGINCIINNLDDFENSPKLMKYVRLFKNDKNISFSGKAHEQIEPSLNKSNYKIIDSKIEIIHHGYNVNEEELKRKAKRNLDLLISDYLINSTSYFAYQIANSYSILDDTPNTIKYFNIAIKDHNLRREFKSICYLHLANFEMRNNNLQKAKILIDKGIKVDNTHTLVNLIASQVYEKLNNKDKSLFYCKKSFELNKKLKSITKSQNVIDIIVDERKIIFEGILLSLKFDSKKYLQLFFKHLSSISQEEYKIINNIIGLQSDNIINEIYSYINEKNLNTVFKLLKYNKDIEFRLELYSKLYDKFNEVSNYLTNFGSFLISINQIDEAKKILELSLSKSDCDDAVIFYLASIYAGENNVNELLSLLKIADKRAENNSMLKSKIIILKEKLQPIINNSIIK